MSDDHAFCANCGTQAPVNEMIYLGTRTIRVEQVCATFQDEAYVCSTQCRDEFLAGA
jgi:hypothetical protein